MKLSPRSYWVGVLLVFHVASLGACCTSAPGNEHVKVAGLCTSPLARSRDMIRAVLDDIAASYTAVGGGGISEIKETGDGMYIVQLPQEERIDLITYEVAIDEHCGVTIVRRTEGVVSYDAEH